MPDHGFEQSTGGVYLLFAHEAYYPAPGKEINTSLVAAGALLHPRVRKPDGTRIHERLTRGRRPGEIVPLATLTHELDGGTLWPQVGDWQGVTADLLQLIHGHGCDGLGLGLPPIARALMCTGPTSEVRAYDPKTEDCQIFGPADRIEVLVEIGRQLARAEAGRPLWPGGISRPGGDTEGEEIFYLPHPQ
ncbi:hypothetical protein [Streptomyces tendae]|uniref:hypothetical protein n=1 Tax=Streptomyces tendae TaxID=1932 RepID=UPI00364C1E7E